MSTLWQETKIHLNQKVGSEGTPKLGLYWVRISHGLNNVVTRSNNNEQDDNEQETSEMQFDDYASKSNARASASRSKAKAKPQRRSSASSSTRTFSIGERTWTDIEPQKKTLSDYPVSKKLINLLRHGCLPRDNDGAIEFRRIKDYLQDHFVFCHHWSDEMWKSSMAGRGGHKRRPQYYTDSSGTILYLRALQGHSGRNLIDPSLQDNVLIPDDFFKYIHHVGCAINFHSIINSGLTPGGQNLSKRQTVFFLPVNPLDKEHKDPEKIDLEAPRLVHNTCRQHGRSIRTRCIGSTSNLLKGKYWCSIKQDRTAIILHGTLPAYCIPKAFSDGNWSNQKRKSIWITSTASKDFLETWLDEGIGFRSCSTTRRRSCWRSKSFPTKLNPNLQIMIERGDPLCAHSPAVSSSTFNEVDIDFRISGLPHSVVKHAENYRVRELVKKIENHPHRQALQADLQQKNAYNPF